MMVTDRMVIAVLLVLLASGTCVGEVSEPTLTTTSSIPTEADCQRLGRAAGQDCSAMRIAAGETTLLRAFKDALNTRDTPEHQRYRDEQAKWSQHRSQECQVPVRSPRDIETWADTVAASPEKTACVLRITEARIEELQKTLVNARATRRYRMTAGFGYTVCEAFLKNVNAFPITEPPMVCDVKIHPQHGQFKKVEWEELPIKDYVQLAYEAELQLPMSRASHPSFESWSTEFLGQVDRNEIVPWLRRTRLALNERGPETLISYERDSAECAKYKLGGGGHIFVRREEPKVKLEPIKGAVGSDLGADILVYRGKPFFYRTTRGSGVDDWWLGLHPVYGRDAVGEDPYVVAKARCEYAFD